MIRGIGIDSVQINRFAHWSTFSRKQLERIFSPAEIDFCLSVPIKSAERFAARFAVREALFKAISQLKTKTYVPFLTLCKLAHVERNAQGVCWLVVDWQKITNDYTDSLHAHLSMTHDKEHAIVVVIIEG